MGSDDDLDPVTRALDVLRRDVERTDALHGYDAGDRLRDAYRAVLERDPDRHRPLTDGRDGAPGPSRRDGPPD